MLYFLWRKKQRRLSQSNIFFCRDMHVMYLYTHCINIWFTYFWRQESETGTEEVIKSKPEVPEEKLQKSSTDYLLPFFKPSTEDVFQPKFDLNINFRFWSEKDVFVCKTPVSMWDIVYIVFHMFMANTCNKRTTQVEQSYEVVINKDLAEP
jgi:hypothetical protein